MEFKPHMKISEYIRRPDLPVPLDVIDKIQVFHAHPMSCVRHLLGSWITVSLSSGYRPPEHENEMGRNQTSEHMFMPLKQAGSELGRGAADYRCQKKLMAKLAVLMIEETNYSRFAYYPQVNTPFIHADFRYPNRTRSFFVVEQNVWKVVREQDFIQTIKQQLK